MDFGVMLKVLAAVAIAAVEVTVTGAVMAVAGATVVGVALLLQKKLHHPQSWRRC